MKTTSICKSLVVCLLVTLFCSAANAYWTDPVFLGELNDYDNNKAANRPSISADENTILFTRYDDYLWEAHRNSETGLFDQQRQLSELQNGGQYAYGSWMSEDNLRLYYASPTSSSVGQRRYLWTAVRDNIDQQWETLQRFEELEMENYLSACSLTADEKMIMYDAAPVGNGSLPYRFFTATRDSTDDPFSNLQERYELETMEAISPNLTPDGLTVHFFRLNNESHYEAWTGSRLSLNVPFGDFMSLDDINQYAINTTGCSQSWDGQHLYARQRWDKPSDLKGIYMYTNIPEPATIVMLCAGMVLLRRN